MSTSTSTPAMHRSKMAITRIVHHVALCWILLSSSSLLVASAFQCPSRGAANYLSAFKFEYTARPSCRITTRTTTTTSSILAAADDDEYDEIDTTQRTNSNNAASSETGTPKKASLSLSELEDLEEARLAALEQEEAAAREAFREAQGASSFTAPSSLYTEATYSKMSDEDPSATPNYAGITTTSSSASASSTQPSTVIDPNRELQLAKKRDILQNSRLNAMFHEEDLATQRRQEKINQLMEEDDLKWREERRKRMMGKYGKVKSVEELKGVMEEERKVLQKEMQTKVNLAKAAGITLTMLEPTDDGSDDGGTTTVTAPETDVDATKSSGSSVSSSMDGMNANGITNTAAASSTSSNDGRSNNDVSSSSNNKSNTKSNFNPTIGGVATKKSWFGGDDAFSLESEFQSLPQTANGEGEYEEHDDENDFFGGDSDEDGTMDGNDRRTTINGQNTDTQYNDVNNNNNEDDNNALDEDGLPRFVNGKLTSREQLMGISVGSAGGWSLEVFPGDFVVHRKYGIGRYEKTVLKSKSKLTPEEKEQSETRRKEIINQLMKEGKQLEDIQLVVSHFGTEKDEDPISNPLTTLLEIAYSDAVVHVPIERAYRLSRYRAGDAAIKPRLSRVKGEAWSKAKRKVEVNTVQMAEDVLALYATRETLNRPPFDPSAESKVKSFSASFQFEPTPDQKKCFEDVENDMVWRSRPMDRLICGDVGFGKTEVAMRALFRCVANGRQSALLAPTGVLAAQHFKQVMRRMGEDSEHKFNVALLRGGMGKNTKKGRELRAAIASGEVDIVVGTHALLSNGMAFKDLGLLTIDEEQRFGVNQKERLKLICNCVDVLTLSATPIPRTLQMSLSGIRDTSTIRSPPPMRKPTISYVQEFEEALIKDAVEREIARDGQCFYVVPRISQLTEANDMLARLFPKLRIIQAHGRMTRGMAEDNVASFAEGNHDVLLATTVIENGVDIPRVNTIIIQNAQAFGMSTLYQLRGRVGRSDLQAYAYFFHKNDAITEQSAQRLQAMADLHELGSGFDVANRDLEIRGAGSLLGTEQSGMAAKVGFDLYMRMLKKSIRQLRGLDLPMVPRSNVLLPGGEGSIEYLVDEKKSKSDETYLIPESYIPDANERVKEEGEARLAESTQRLVEITNTWRESHGALPSDLQDNLKALHLHTCLRQLGIDVVGLDESSGDCVLRSPGLRPRHWAMICSQLPRKAPPKGLDVVFPARFTFSKHETEIIGGKKVNLEELLPDSNYGEDEEEWDALDEEEVEAMKEISSAVSIKNLSEIEIHNYPRFVLKNMGTSIKEGSRVDALLKVLLPPSKVVFEKQQRDKEKAKVAAELREKRELIQKQKKEQEKLSARRGYAPY